MAVIGSVITWIAHPMSSFVHKGLGLPAAAHTNNAAVRAPIPPPTETRAEAILSGCNAAVSSRDRTTTAAASASASASATPPPRDPAHPRAASNPNSDKGRPPPGPALASAPAQPMMDRSQPLSRRQSNVGGSGNHPFPSRPAMLTVLG